MTSTLSRKKKALLLLCILCCIFVAYLQIFTIRSKANAVVGGGLEDVKVIGFPCNLYYYNMREGGDFAGTSYGVIPNFNLFVDDESGTPTWAEGHGSSTPVQVFNMRFTNSESVSDLYIDFSSYTWLDHIESCFDVVFTDPLTFRRDYGYSIVLPYSVAYTVSCTIVGYNGSSLVRRSFFSDSIQPASTSDGYYYYCFPASVFNEQFFYNYADFTYEGQRAVWISDFSVNFRTPTNVPLSPTFAFGFEAAPYTALDYDDFVYYFKDALIGIFDASEVVVDFEDLSWTDWLVNSVGSFMNFEFIPGFSISGIFALLVGMSLFMVFLKVFAGG